MSDVRMLPVGEGNEEVAFALDELAREGARRMIAVALKAEADEYVERFSDEVDGDGHREVLRNGRARERRVTVGSGRSRYGRRGSTTSGSMRRVSGRSSAHGSCPPMRGGRRRLVR